MALIVTPPGSPAAKSYVSIEAIHAYAVKYSASFPIAGGDETATAAAIVAAEAAARRRASARS